MRTPRGGGTKIVLLSFLGTLISFPSPAPLLRFCFSLTGLDLWDIFILRLLFSFSARFCQRQEEGGWGSGWWWN